MSIASEISRLQTAKADIKTAIEAKGVTVPSSATIDTYDDYVSQISGGGGSTTPSAFTSWEYTDYGRPTKIVVSNSTTSIPSYFQYYNNALSSCTIPSSLTLIGDYAFAYVGRYIQGAYLNALDVSNINLSGIVYGNKCSYLFSASYLKGNLTIPSSLFSGSTSGTSSICYNLFYNARVISIYGDNLNLNVYANNVIIPRGAFFFDYYSGNSNGLKLTINGTPTFLSQQAFACSTGGSITFADCTNPPNAPSYGTSSSSPFYNFKGTLYVPSAGLTAWKNKYTGISSKIKAIGT